MEAANLQPGDILACYGTDLVSRAISLRTASLLRPRRLWLGPSHVAMVVEDQRHGLLWVESTSKCDHPCVLRREPIAGVQAHYPETRAGDYHAAGGYVDVWRLTPVMQLSRDESRLLSRIVLRHFVARAVPYDMLGAIISGTRLLRLTQLFRRDQHDVFCSELLAALCQRMGRMNHEDPTRFSPARLLRRLARQGTYQFAGALDVNFRVARFDDALEVAA